MFSFNNIKYIAMDVDGVLTDGKYIVSSTGDISKSFYTRDFDSMEKLMKKGIGIIIISQSRDTVIKEQINRLTSRRDSFWRECKDSILFLFCGIEDKKKRLEAFLEEKKLTWDNIAYIGDSDNDLESMKSAAFAACPFDAVEDIHKEISYLSNCMGGRGVVSDVCRYVLKQIKKEKEKI
jgi:3-deoxy-D-manno-octulosonate 8-phosphate phosphatase (KDO 8-P phosphatase)